MRTEIYGSINEDQIYLNYVIIPTTLIVRMENILRGRNQNIVVPFTLYFNYNGTFRIVTFMLVDVDYQFLCVDAR